MIETVRRFGGRAVRCTVGVLAIVTLSPPNRLTAQGGAGERGKAVYDKWCSSCHGETGAGDGPAAQYMYPRPRDFTTALYQVRTTASGELPTDADMMHAIDVGLPGTAMPGWKDYLSRDDRRALVAYLKTFSSFFEGATPEPLDLGKAPGGGDDALRIGRLMYDSIGCAKCHGQEGRGDGPSASELDDDFGHPMLAADLSEHWRFNAGGRVEDIYRTLRTGFDGTPMPSFSDLIDQQYLTDQELWHLAQYVRSLSPEKQPTLRDVIIAERVDSLPTTPDDSAWAEVDQFWFPLVGQIIRKARWFNPAVSGVYVRAVHDGERIAVRVAWHDRSESPSPDPDWQAYARKVLAGISVDDATPPVVQPWPDQIAVQFPRRIPSGMERPYFLMGSGTDPVYQWRWRSQPRGGEEGTARGLERYDAHTGEGQDVRTEAVYDHGEWRVVFTRTLATADTANDLQFQAGRAIPIAFFAWDGSGGEHGSRLAVSSWYYIALAEPVPPTVYLAPIVAVVLTFGLGLWVVRRANHGKRGA